MRRFVFLSLMLVLVAGVPAGASTFLDMSQRELVQGSAAVVEGEILQVHSFWDSKGRMMITEAIVKVADSVVGNIGSAIVVRTFGGTVEGYTVEAHGFPTFRRGERLLLFLESERDGAHRVTGYQLGQYRIVRDKNGLDVAVPSLDKETSLINREGRQAPRPRALALETLKNQIRNEAASLGRN
jgi:hypothetical protein